MQTACDILTLGNFLYPQSLCPALSTGGNVVPSFYGGWIKNSTLTMVPPRTVKAKFQYASLFGDGSGLVQSWLRTGSEHASDQIPLRCPAC